MTQDIDSLFEKFKDVFIARQEDIKEFIVKYSNQLFKNKDVIFVERRDSSNLINISGFRTNVSSWRDSAGNPIISTCLKEGDVKKRYDYVFHLSKEESVSTKEETEPAEIDEEKLDYGEISNDISKIFDESVKFSHSLQFERAIMTLDSMIELLLEKDLTEYTKKLQAKRDYLKAAQEVMIHRSKELQELNKKIEGLSQDNILIKDKSQFQESISNVNELINELQEKAFPGYAKVLEEKRKEIEKAQEIYEDMKKDLSVEEQLTESEPVDAVLVQQLKNLERMININREYNQYEAAKVNLHKMIQILKSINRDDLAARYSQELKEIEAQISN